MMRRGYGNQKNGGAHWTRDPWQVRLFDADGDPLTTWRYAETLAEVRQEFAQSEANSAEIKRDGKAYGTLIRVGVRPKLIRADA